MPAMTARGVKEADVEVIADILDDIMKECLAIQEKVGKKLVDFIPPMKESENLKEIAARVRVRLNLKIRNSPNNLSCLERTHQHY